MAIGDILGLIDDYLFYNTGNGVGATDICQVDGDVYAVVTESDDGIGNLIGVLSTFRVNVAGAITPALIDQLIFDAVAAHALGPTIIKRSGTTYAILRTDGAANAHITTVTIQNNGTITGVIANLATGVNGFTRERKLVQVAGDTYAFALAGGPTVGTVSITAAGALANIASRDFGYANNKHLDFKRISSSGNNFAICFTSNAVTDTIVFTFTISDAGVISIEIANLHIDTTSGTLDSTRLAKIAASTNKWVALYPDNAAQTAISTFVMNDDGTLGGAVIATQVIDVNGYDSSSEIDRVGTSTYIFAYKRPLAGAGKTRGVSIVLNADGTIGASGANGALLTAGQELIFNNLFKAGNVYISGGRTTGVGPEPGHVFTYGVETVQPATVQTDPATGVTQAAATLNGTLLTDGGEHCDCCFEWGATVAYGNTTAIQSKTTGQTFNQAIAHVAGITYHFRAKATNGAGTVYGADQTFFFPNPVVLTESAVQQELMQAFAGGY